MNSTGARCRGFASEVRCICICFGGFSEFSEEWKTERSRGDAHRVQKNCFNASYWNVQVIRKEGATSRPKPCNVCVCWNRYDMMCSAVTAECSSVFDGGVWCVRGRRTSDIT